MANIIKTINVGGTPYEVYDEYARRRLEGLTVVYTIDSSYTTAKSGDTFVDWDTGADVASSAMTIKNGAFASTNKDITVSGVTAGTNAYLVLTSTKAANKYYVKHMAFNEETGHPGLNIGDTVYVTQDNYPDRWLSASVESPLSAVFTTLESKIDLSEYAKKTEAGKAGTYTTGNGGAGNTGSAGEQTAVVTISGIKYDKADANTGNAGGATITTTSGGAVSIAYTPEGTVSQPTFSAGAAAEAGAHTHSVTAAGAISVGTGTANYTPAGTISAVTAAAHSHTVNVSKATVTNNVTGTETGSAGAHEHSVSVSGDITLGDLEVSQAASGTATYTPAGSISVTPTAAGTTAVVSSVSAALAATPTFTGTAATISISGDVTGTAVADHTYTPEGTISAVTADAHSHKVDSHEHSATVTAVSAYPNFSGGSASGTFNTDAIKDITLAASTVTTDGPKYIEDVTHTEASLTGDTTFVKSLTNWNGGSFTSGTFSQGSLPSYTQGSKAAWSASVNDSGILSFSWTANGDDTWSAGTLPTHGTDSFTGATATITGGSVGISGGSISKTTKYMKKTTTAASTGSVSWTAAALGTPTTVNAAGVASAKTLTSTTAGAISVTPTFTGTEATLAHSVTQGSFSGSAAYTPAGTVSKPSISVTAPTVSVNTDAIKAVSATFTGTGARLLAAAGTVQGEMTGTAASAGAHTHSLTNSALTYVTGATTGTAGAIDVTPEFTGTGAELVFTGSAVTSTSAGAHTHTVSGTVSQPTFTGTAATLSQDAHTHSVTIASHSHTIGATSTSVSGSASAAISNHTHTIGNHTHSVTVDPIKAA